MVSKILMLPQHKLDALIAHHRLYMLLSFGLLLLGRFTNAVGVISGVMLIFLGACCGFLQPWRTVRGLWMLSGLFALFSFIFYVFFEYGEMMDLIQGRGAGIGIVGDMAVGTAVLWMQVRLLYSVTFLNRRLSSSSEDT